MQLRVVFWLAALGLIASCSASPTAAESNSETTADEAAATPPEMTEAVETAEPGAVSESVSANESNPADASPTVAAAATAVTDAVPESQSSGPWMLKDSDALFFPRDAITHDGDQFIATAIGYERNGDELTESAALLTSPDGQNWTLGEVLNAWSVASEDGRPTEYVEVSIRTLANDSWYALHWPYDLENLMLLSTDLATWVALESTAPDEELDAGLAWTRSVISHPDSDIVVARYRVSIDPLVHPEGPTVKCPAPCKDRRGDVTFESDLDTIHQQMFRLNGDGTLTEVTAPDVTVGRLISTPAGIVAVPNTQRNLQLWTGSQWETYDQFDLPESPGFATSHQGRLYMLRRPEDQNDSQTRISFSDDGGATWTDQLLDTPWDNHGRNGVLTASEGEAMALVMSYGDLYKLYHAPDGQTFQFVTEIEADEKLRSPTLLGNRLAYLVSYGWEFATLDIAPD